ncbi:MAG TPA: hypothetical protein VMT76_12025 [Puia sp.]|nr:hypothetical protein [Puia sp.]
MSLEQRYMISYSCIFMVVGKNISAIYGSGGRFIQSGQWLQAKLDNIRLQEYSFDNMAG